MKMNRIKWIAVYAGILLGFPMASYSQNSMKYPYVEDGAPIIVSKDAKGGVIEQGLLTSEQFTYLSQGNTMDIASEYNRVSSRFQIAESSLYFNDQITTARKACTTYAEADTPAGSWRLPTIKELCLIWELRNQLKTTHGLDFFDYKAYPYLSCLGNAGSTICIKNEDVHPTTVSVGHAWDTTKGYYVRCIRDLN